jgi:peptidoglycan/LPS O-acetylase OafA/YrhL
VVINPLAHNSFKLGYLPALDGLRGVAILMVMAIHAAPRPACATGGFIGVDIFFTLSGFLITILLLEEWDRLGSIRLKHFYVRRILRLLPALAAVLLVTCLITCLFRSRWETLGTLRSALSILLYHFNWRLVFHPGPHALSLIHLWSLSVEEQFYFLWPMILLALLKFRVRPPWILALVFLGIVASACWRAVQWQEELGIGRAYLCTDTHADGLLTGCLAGMLVFWKLVPKRTPFLALLRRGAWAAIGLLGCHFVAASHEVGDYMYYGGFSLVSLAAAVILIAVVKSPPPLLTAILESPLLVWMGRISYALYLWHFLVIWWLFPFLVATPMFHPESHPFRCVLVEAGISLAVAAMSYYGIERPVLKWKSRLNSDGTLTLAAPINATMAHGLGGGASLVHAAGTNTFVANVGPGSPNSAATTLPGLNPVSDVALSASAMHVGHAATVHHGGPVAVDPFVTLGSVGCVHSSPSREGRATRRFPAKNARTLRRSQRKRRVSC